MQLRLFLFSLAFLLSSLCHSSASLTPQEVAVLYNKNIPESVQLAQYYAQARQIPEANLIGLDVPDLDEVKRKDYDLWIRQALLKEFVERTWFPVLPPTEKGKQNAVIQSPIKALVCLRGVPYKVARDASIKSDTPMPPQYAQANEASVDAELSLLGVSNAPIVGPLPNPYFQKASGYKEANIPWAMLMVTRIDGPSYKQCRELIDQAIACEKSGGLWGRAFLDVAQKFPQGDQWIQNIAKHCDRLGIPAILDSQTNTLPTNYPMTESAIYFGWYSPDGDGALRDPKFSFKPGAVAVHLHSFSAQNLRSTTLNWCGPILNRGATATLGNVYEPYLHLTHHLDIFFERLTAGYCLAEAAYMAQPAISWQSVVIGDPLYRPFLHFTEAKHAVKEEDRVYQAFRLAHIEWQHDFEMRLRKLRSAAVRMNSGTLYEALGWQQARRAQTDQASAFFDSAKNTFSLVSDKARQDLNQIELSRINKRKDQALALIDGALKDYGNAPVRSSFVALRNILNPPPPAPAKNPKTKTNSPQKP